MQDDDDPRADRDLRDRLLRVENSLFLLKAKSRYFPDWDNTEVERLERLRQDLYLRSAGSEPEGYPRGAPTRSTPRDRPRASAPSGIELESVAKYRR